MHNSITSFLFKKSYNCFTPIRSIHWTTVQNLYSASFLCIDNYVDTRKKLQKKLRSHKQNLLELEQYLYVPNSGFNIDNLKNIIFLAGPGELSLIIDVIKKFSTDEKNFIQSSVKFSLDTWVMRMFHYLDAPKEAYQCFENAVKSNFFNHKASFQILLDLLFKHKMYDEMFKVFEALQECVSRNHKLKFPMYTTVLIFGACYKQNTHNSFEYASNLWSTMTENGWKTLNRAREFYTALAVNQGAPDIALKCLENEDNFMITLTNIKAVALAEAGRPVEAFRLLKLGLQKDSPKEMSRYTFIEETICRINSAVDKSEDRLVQKEFKKIVTALRTLNLIRNQTLDDRLSMEINIMSLNEKQEQAQRNGMPSWYLRYLNNGSYPPPDSKFVTRKS